MRGYSFITTFSLLAILNLIAGCNYDIIKNRGGSGAQNAAEGVLPASTVIDWSLVQSYSLNVCTQCHAGKQSPALNSWNSVQQNISGVVAQVTSQKMPPASEGYSPLSACAQAIVTAWAQMGAPQTSTQTVASLPACVQSPATTAPPSVPISIVNQPLSYQVLLTQILQPKCMKCHNPMDPSDASDTLFSPYSTLVADTATWSAPGASSRVVTMVTRTDSGRMPPPPPDGGDPLSADEVNYIVRWIDAGHPQ